MLLQFLTEAVLLPSFAGIFGIILALGASFGFIHMMGIPFLPDRAWLLSDNWHIGLMKETRHDAGKNVVNVFRLMVDNIQVVNCPQASCLSEFQLS